MTSKSDDIERVKSEIERLDRIISSGCKTFKVIYLDKFKSLKQKRQGLENDLEKLRRNAP